MSLKDFLLEKTPPKQITTAGGLLIHVRKLNAAESADYTYMGTKGGTLTGQMEMDVKAFAAKGRWLVSRALVDEQGKRVLNDVEVSQVEEDKFQDIYAAIQTELKLDVAKAVDDEKKD